MSFVQCSTTGQHSAVHHYEWRPARPAALAAAPTVVFSNALGTDHRIWDGVVAELPESWSILRYDTRGHGLSEAGERPYDIALLCADLSELLGRLGIGPVILCGLSLGGLIAQGFALAHPERVRGLCLCGTAPRIGSHETWQQRIEQVNAGGVAAIADTVLGRWFGAPFRERDAAAVRGCRVMFERTSRAGYVAAAAALRDADLTAGVAAINVPSLVIAGELDVATPPEQLRALASSIRGSRFEILPGAGHLMCVEEPRALARSLSQLVSSIVVEPDASAANRGRSETNAGDAERFAQGMRIRRAVLGDAHVDRASREATEFDRDFQEYITRAAWGEVWVRPGLTLEARHLITIAMLAVLNRQDELAMHVAATRNTGVSAVQVKETLMQVAVYAGAPAARSALETARRALYGEG